MAEAPTQVVGPSPTGVPASSEATHTEPPSIPSQQRSDDPKTLSACHCGYKQSNGRYLIDRHTSTVTTQPTRCG